MFTLSDCTVTEYQAIAAVISADPLWALSAPASLVRAAGLVELVKTMDARAGKPRDPAWFTTATVAELTDALDAWPATESDPDAGEVAAAVYGIADTPDPTAPEAS